MKPIDFKKLSGGNIDIEARVSDYLCAMFRQRITHGDDARIAPPCPRFYGLSDERGAAVRRVFKRWMKAYAKLF